MEEKPKETFDEILERIGDEGPKTAEDILITAGIVFAMIVSALVVLVCGLGAVFMLFKALFTLSLLSLLWAVLMIAAASVCFAVLAWFALKADII